MIETDIKLVPTCLVLKAPSGVLRGYALQAALRRCINERIDITLKLGAQYIIIKYQDIVDHYTPDNFDMDELV